MAGVFSYPQPININKYRYPQNIGRDRMVLSTLNAIIYHSMGLVTANTKIPT